MDVFASDFQVMEKRGEDVIAIPSSQFFHPHKETHDTCLLAVLKPLMPGGKPEELRIKAKATVGVGRQNARFIPTSQCAYAYTRDNDPVHVKEVFESWLSRVKMINDPKVLEQDPERLGALTREFKTLEINRCYLKDEGGEPYSFDFTIESVGVLSPEWIVYRACEKGADLCKKYADENLGQDVVVQPVETQLLGFDFIFQGQDHTLGHLIQAWLDQKMVGQGELTFAGYDIPHPLRDEMVIRIGVADGQESTARKALRSAMIACQGMFEMWRDQWKNMTQPDTTKTVSMNATPAAPIKRIIRRPTTTVA
jgi:DNA-directed RNA polymerase subunit L